MSDGSRVQPLKKIKLALRAGAGAGGTDIARPGAEVAFIFGIASGGLTPFECLLNDRAENEEIAFTVAGPQGDLFFGHLAQHLGRLFEGRDQLCFNVRIVGVETPQPREIIKAMAEMAGHGHGAECDCGCGCG
jgi:hypothetical protein